MEIANNRLNEGESSLIEQVESPLQSRQMLQIHKKGTSSSFRVANLNDISMRNQMDQSNMFDHDYINLSHEEEDAGGAQPK